MYSPASVLSSYERLPDKIGEIVLYIIRHAEVKNDKQKLIRGLSNQGLDDKGQEQAKELADFFSDRPLSGIYTDDLKRAYQTALPIAAEQDLEVEIDAMLRSWDVGSDLEGKPIEKNRDEIAELRQQPDKIPPGGQSWADYTKQVESWFTRYVTQGMDNDDPVAVVTHGSAIQVLWNGLGEEVDADKYDEIPLEPAGVAGIYLTRFGQKVRILRGKGVALDE
jgi:broad specificity phosphatase PhoE